MAEQKEITIILLLTIASIAVLATLIILKLNKKSPLIHAPGDAEPYKMSDFNGNESEILRSVCQSQECILLADQLNNWIDPLVSPCDDFFKHSCGKYAEHIVINGDRKEFQKLINLNLLEKFLWKNRNSTSKSKRIMGYIYDRCAKAHHSKTEKKERANLMREVFNDIKNIGSWPILERNWNELGFDLNERLMNMAKSHITDFGLFSVSINNNELFVKRSQSVLTISNKNYPKAIKNILSANSITFNETSINEDMRDVYMLVRRISNVDFPRFPQLIPLENVASNGKINYENVIRELINRKSTPQDWHKVKNKIVVADQTKYYEEIDKILQETPSATIANFLVLMFIDSAFDNTYRLIISPKSACVAAIQQFFPLAVLQFFVQNNFDKKNLNAASEIIKHIRKTYVEIINEATWLNSDEKERAVLKVQKMQNIVGYPKELDEPELLDNSFDMLEISANDSLYAIMKKILRFISELSMEYGAGNFPINPKSALNDVNAFYEISKNQLFVPAGLLDEPTFHWSYPSYAGMATVGIAISTEMSHTFDRDGIRHDETGKPQNLIDGKEMEIYEENTQCLIQQYNDYDDPDYGRNLNGSMVIDELIAGNIGNNVAYRTYRTTIGRHDEDILGFENYNHNIIYFYMLAIDNCQRRSTLPLSEMLKTTTLSFRVNGNLQNMQSFSDAFKCPVGSPMNPKRKCKVM